MSSFRIAITAITALSITAPAWAEDDGSADLPADEPTDADDVVEAQSDAITPNQEVNYGHVEGGSFREDFVNVRLQVEA